MNTKEQKSDHNLGRVEGLDEMNNVSIKVIHQSVFQE